MANPALRKGPCLNCEARHPACWGECEKYKAYHERNEGIKKEMTRGKEADAMTRQRVERKKKIAKRWKWERWIK